MNNDENTQGDDLKTAGGKPARHPAVATILQFFSWNHLPEPLRSVSQPFGVMAEQLADSLPDNDEKTVCLRKLLEAKDCAVRASLDTGRRLD